VISKLSSVESKILQFSFISDLDEIYRQSYLLYKKCIYVKKPQVFCLSLYLENRWMRREKNRKCNPQYNTFAKLTWIFVFGIKKHKT
jgi:hypothetical protein